MYELALFAGVGGGLLASRLLGWRTVCYVERDPYCARVLQARMRDGWLDVAPIWDDVRTFDGRPWAGCVDVLTAGFPCQPFSVAGRRKAGADARNGWPDTLRILRACRPPFAFLENVPGLLSPRHGYFGVILGDLAQSGYGVRWRRLSAAELGAPHRRDRVWLVAYAERNGVGGIGDLLAAPPPQAGHVWPAPEHGSAALADAHGDGRGDGPAEPLADPWGLAAAEPGVGGAPLANTDSPGPQDGRLPSPALHGSWWEAEPPLGRVVDGFPHRVDQLRALGNAQVPVVAARVWRLLTADLGLP